MEPLGGTRICLSQITTDSSSLRFAPLGKQKCGEGRQHKDRGFCSRMPTPGLPSETQERQATRLSLHAVIHEFNN